MINPLLPDVERFNRTPVSHHPMPEYLVDDEFAIRQHLTVSGVRGKDSHVGRKAVNPGCQRRNLTYLGVKTRGMATEILQLII